MTYQHKSLQEKNLQKRIEKANLSDSNFRDMFWRLWGAFSIPAEHSVHKTHWGKFSAIVDSYLKEPSFKELIKTKRPNKPNKD